MGMPSDVSFSLLRVKARLAGESGKQKEKERETQRERGKEGKRREREMGARK